MLRILTVVGARPQFIKASAISRCVKHVFSERIEEKLLHTGQHYDTLLSDIFFQQLGIPAPSFHLQVSSSGHAKQTAEMLLGVEKAILEYNPDVVLLYGDTNSTLAAALAASKLHTPIAHIEAGLRSFDKKMPEEINRIITDHLSTFLYVPTAKAYQNLQREGLTHHTEHPASPDNPVVFNSGDVMYENVLYFLEIAKKTSTISHQLNLNDKKTILCTIHRDFNTDNEQRLKNMLNGLLGIANTFTHSLVIPLHPRTSSMLDKPIFSSLKLSLKTHPRILLTEPVSYFDMLCLVDASDMVITDSGGLQKEAYFLRKPVAVLRNTTEWTEIIESGNGWLTDDDPLLLLNACKQAITLSHENFPLLYGDGNAAQAILNNLLTHIR
ncbi:MAG: UDP-N-acetylglucosamine 2-epimerase (non-hydrolyzing) [Flavobacteriales bacterium]|nr:UDP-N-acetylglucosamine 2-epimerase (non-hydrolyzing) [Flavobacteriales bacterium]